MRKSHTLIVVGLLGVLAAAGWSQTAGSAQQGFTGADIAEIQQLYVRYNQASTSRTRSSTCRPGPMTPCSPAAAACRTRE